MNQSLPKKEILDRLYGIAIIESVTTGLIAAGLTIYVGGTPLLLVIFVLWVLSPFAGLAFAAIRSKTWKPRGQMILYGLIMLLSLASLVVYGINAVSQLGDKPAFIFLVVPLVSWVLIAVVVPLATVKGKE
jgi:hypothetical protein